LFLKFEIENEVQILLYPIINAFKRLYVRVLKDYLSFATCFMQLKNSCMQLFLVECDMCSCIKQVAKDNFSPSHVKYLLK
jgi:hypothetical protein